MLEVNVLKYSTLILLIFYQHLYQLGKLILKESKIRLELLTDINMLLMGEKSIRQKCVIQYIDMQKQIINTSKSVIKKNHNYSICRCK